MEAGESYPGSHPTEVHGNPKPHLVEPGEDADPERIKRRLQEILDCHETLKIWPLETSPLAKLIVEQIRGAIDSGDVMQMLTAAKVADEAAPLFNRDGEIPF